MADPILSPDGKLQIIRHSILYPTMGPKSVQGTVKNLSDVSVDAEITVEFYDESGNALGQSTGVCKSVAPGETKIFEVWAERLPNMYETESHKIVSVRAMS